MHLPVHHCHSKMQLRDGNLERISMNGIVYIDAPMECTQSLMELMYHSARRAMVCSCNKALYIAMK